MRTGLAFSGGKDSWACLWLNADRLDEIDVVWVNTGKNYPELLATIVRARSMCPHFHEVRTDRDAQNALEGLPADVVPINWTRWGHQVTGTKPAMVQSYLGCCYENISGPLHAKAKELGLTEIIRGQRNDEGHKSSGRDGDVHEGITIRQPIEHWTAQQVMEYLRTKMDIPAHFALKHSSMDCYDCTAYRAESGDRIEFMRNKHPALYEAYATRTTALNNALQESLGNR